ncbi:unnamed protein product [Thelazia callipaeda]|uniref:Calponin-homology (CH) domain-containing protein n=1 Tax=Thelazia callipaeda TaxID=103827 RepID=A0A158RBA7_THECL|nr:unnamed protein product [Thelazia callipaeda]
MYSFLLQFFHLINAYESLMQDNVCEQRLSDTSWKWIQQNTFTRWVNQKLEPANITITDLETDFEEGLTLIRLVEVLSGRSLGRYSKKVTFRHQKLENISLALRFLEEEEHIKIVNIDSSAIVDRNLKLILGLIWKLILHYSISKQVWDDNAVSMTESEDISPKAKLMMWLKGKLPTGLPFTNFTSDWNDGILLGALVDSCIPELQVNWQNWLPSQALHSTRTAMNLAKEYLNVAPLIAPEELISPAVDERSVMTYVSQFLGAKYTPLMGYLSNVNVTPIVGANTEFTLQMRDSMFIPEIHIRGPDDSLISHTQCKTSETMWNFVYKPEITGKYEIVATIRDNATCRLVQLACPEINAVEGVRLLYHKHVSLGKSVELKIENARKDFIEVVIIAPDHQVFVIPMSHNIVRKGSFTPTKEGLHEVNILQNGKEIIGSPFPLVVISKALMNVWGRGLEPEGIQVGEEVIVCANYNKSILEAPRLVVKNPCGFSDDLSVPVDEEESLDCKIFKYQPQEPGSHTIALLIGEDHIDRSPYKVMVISENKLRARAFGPGLDGGFANLPNVFFIETFSRNFDHIDVDVSGSPWITEQNFMNPTVELKSNQDGSAVASFTPPVPGVYTVKVCVTGQHIRGSPFIVPVQQADDDFKVINMRLTGIKQDLTILKGQNVMFGINSIDDKVLPEPKIKVLDENNQEMSVTLTERMPGQYECSFTPEMAGRYYILASVNGVAVPGSLDVVCLQLTISLTVTFIQVVIKKLLDVSCFLIYGTGIGRNISVSKPATVIIDPQEDDVKPYHLQIIHQNGNKIHLQTMNEENGTIRVDYIAPEAGQYELILFHDDLELLRKIINVKPIDLSSFVINGLGEEAVVAGITKQIFISTGNLVPLGKGLEVIVKEPNRSGYVLPLKYDENRVAYKGMWIATNIGKTVITYFFDENLVHETHVTVSPNEYVIRCRAWGDGLQRAIVGMPANFQVYTRDSGKGRLKVAIRGPSESETNVTDHSDGLCTVKYVPQLPGIYEISIHFGDNEDHIPGSPFSVSVDYKYDPSKILISGYNNGYAQAGVSTSFIVDATHTALEPITARLPAGCEQPLVEEIKPRIYRVTFTPSPEKDGLLPLEVLYGDQLLHGRPLDFTVQQEKESQLVILKDETGAALRSSIPASLRYGVIIDASKVINVQKLEVEIKAGPDGKFRKSAFIETDERVYLLDLIPDMIGTYVIIVYGDGKPLHPLPYELNATSVGSAEKCYIERKPMDKIWIVGESKTFKVNVCYGGDGTLSIASDREDLEIDVQEEGKGYYLVTFTPRKEGSYQIALLFGGVAIPSGTFNFQCVPPVAEKPNALLSDSGECLDNIEERLIPRTFRFSVTSKYHFEKLSAYVKMPSGKTDAARIKDNRDGTVTVTYEPKECGNHLLSVQHDGVNMSGSPISFYVSDAPDGYVTVYGPGLSQAVVGEPAPFTVCAKGSPAKELAVAVEGTAKATIRCHDNKDGTCSVAWIPPVPGEYRVHVKLSGEPVKGSPFVVVVAGEGQKRAHLSVGSTSEVSLNIANKEIKGLSASIKSPSGIEEPCFIRQIDFDHIGVSFTPREEGEHLITVKKKGVVVPKSPFHINVDSSQVGDASKVVVSGTGKADAICQQYNSVMIDTRGAGYGGLSVSVEGPSKAELKCTEANEGLINIVYKPTEPGLYVLSIKFADVHVKDSPFTVHCVGKGLGTVKMSATKEVNQAPIVIPHQIAALYLRLENTSPIETTAKVLDPEGRSSDVEVRDLGDNLYQVKFKPEVDGAHAISVFSKGQHLTGSPFQFTVGHMTEMGAHKVRAAGIELLRGETNKKQSFNLYTREAGRGELQVAIEGPSKANLQFHEHKDGNCHFDYEVSKPGEYMITIKFNSEHIPDSPFKVFVAPTTGEARRLELASFPDSGMPGKACTFTVLTHHASGHLEAKVHTPSNKIETIDIVPIDEGESYALRFIPLESGNYYVDVTLDGAPMRDSPFRLRIGTNDGNDPTAITVNGDGIHGGQTGQRCEFIINTCNAGKGLLEIQVDGPSKVTLDAYEMDQGYKVQYMALVPGAYYVAIKYSGVHVPGSPFKIIIAGKELGGGEPDTSVIKIDALEKTSEGTVSQVPVLNGDASRVVVKGAGLNKFFPGRPATFTIDTGLAGENLLFVGVLTAKGPCEEVTVRHLSDGKYAVTYRIQERVKGFIFVKYGEANVPGSPFAISF